jgi:hypothetical protein
MLTSYSFGDFSSILFFGNNKLCECISNVDSIKALKFIPTNPFCEITYNILLQLNKFCFVFFVHFLLKAITNQLLISRRFKK